jgi:hypothetical protein
VRLQTVLGTLRSRLNAIYRVRREFEIGQYPVAAQLATMWTSRTAKPDWLMPNVSQEIS